MLAISKTHRHDRHVTEEVLDSKSDYYSLVRTCHIVMEHHHPQLRAAATLLPPLLGNTNKTRRLKHQPAHHTLLESLFIHLVDQVKIR